MTWADWTEDEKRAAGQTALDAYNEWKGTSYNYNIQGLITRSRSYLGASDAVTHVLIGKLVKAFGDAIAHTHDYHPPPGINMDLIGHLTLHALQGKTKDELVEMLGGGSGGGDGMRHDEARLSCAFLYEEPFLASARIMGMTDDERATYLSQSVVQQGNAVLVTINQGARDSIRALPFNGWTDPATVQRVFHQIIDADKAPIAVLTDQTYWAQTLERDIDDLYRCLEECADAVAPLSKVIIAMWEVGDIFTGDDLEERRELNRRIRRGTVLAGYPERRIGVHERSLEGIPVQDIPPEVGPSMSCLQTGFDTSADDAVEFLAENVARMQRREASGAVYPGHIVGVMEHSIPFVYAGQSWQPTRTLSQAETLGQRLIDEGDAAFDWSGGATR